MQLQMLINCQFDAAKIASNTKRYNFAGKKIANDKATLCINMEFQKIARYIELENFSNRDFIIVMLFETNSFLRFT